MSVELFLRFNSSHICSSHIYSSQCNNSSHLRLHYKLTARVVKSIMIKI